MLARTQARTASAEAGACVADRPLPRHQERHWDRGRFLLVFRDDLLAVCHYNAGRKGFLEVGPRHNLCEPAEGFDGHEGHAFAHITIFFLASEGGQEEVSHEGNVQRQAGRLTQGPKVREVHACIEVLLERANTERSKQAREMLGKVLGGSKLRVQVAMRKKSCLRSSLGLDLHSCCCRAQLPSLGRRRQARRAEGWSLVGVCCKACGRTAAKAEGCAGRAETLAGGCHARLRGVGRTGGGGKPETGVGRSPELHA